MWFGENIRVDIRREYGKFGFNVGGWVVVKVGFSRNLYLGFGGVRYGLIRLGYRLLDFRLYLVDLGKGLDGEVR